MLRKNGVQDFSSYRSDGIDFTSLPSAALHPGLRVRCNPIAANQPYFWVESDGASWRPINGRALIWKLGDEVIGTTDAAEQILTQVTIPPGMLVTGDMLRWFMGGERRGGVADTVGMRCRLGSTGTLSDTLLWGLTLATTSINFGVSNIFKATSSTTILKCGASGIYSINPFGTSSATANAAPVTVSDLSTDPLYLTFCADLTTGGTEYPVIHQLSIEWYG